MNLIKSIISTIAAILAVSSSACSQEVKQNSNDTKAETLIAALYSQPWTGAENNCSPMCWDFQFTEPMQKILEIGLPAQEALLEKISDVR